MAFSNPYAAAQPTAVADVDQKVLGGAFTVSAFAAKPQPAGDTKSTPASVTDTRSALPVEVCQSKKDEKTAVGARKKRTLNKPAPVPLTEKEKRIEAALKPEKDDPLSQNVLAKNAELHDQSQAQRERLMDTVEKDGKMKEEDKEKIHVELEKRMANEKAYWRLNTLITLEAARACLNHQDIITCVLPTNDSTSESVVRLKLQAAEYDAPGTSFSLDDDLDEVRASYRVFFEEKMAGIRTTVKSARKPFTAIILSYATVYAENSRKAHTSIDVMYFTTGLGSKPKAAATTTDVTPPTAVAADKAKV